MKVILLLAPLMLLPGMAYADIPDWIKNSAGWWADEIISDAEFIHAIQYLIQEEIIQIPPTSVNDNQTEGIPEWVKSSALWWSQDITSDEEFVNAIQYLISQGIITIQDDLQKKLDECSKHVKISDRSDCKKMVQAEITIRDYKTNGDAYPVGDVTFYYKGNDFEITPSGQAIVSLSILAENNSDSNVTLMCTGPSICNYDVWNGDKAFKYSGMDFTNGQIVLRPNEAREFSMLFGPNIGYGGTTFEYDPSKDYVFRISEPWGKTTIPLHLE